MAWKLLLNLFVRVLEPCTVYPKRMSWVRRILENLSFQEAGEVCNSSIEGRGQPIIFWAVVMILWRARKPHTHAVCQNALNRSNGKRHQQVLCELVILSILRKYSLCCAFLMIIVVFDTPGQIVLHVNAQKPEVRDCLHTVTADEKRLNVCFLPFEVYYQFLPLMLSRSNYAY